MKTKLVLALVACGVICLLQQPTPTDAAGNHVRELQKVFRGIDFDFTKKAFYLHRAKYGVQNQLRNPLCTKAMSFPRNSKLSKPCLNEMIKAVNDLEGTFYAGFSFNCHDHDQYSMDCLEAAEPAYLTGLKQLADKTLKCLVQK